MGLYDDEDEEGYSVQMIPKNGAKDISQPSSQDAAKITEMRPTLSSSDAEVADAKQGWIKALKNNLRQPVDAAVQGIEKFNEGMRNRPQYLKGKPDQMYVEPKSSFDVKDQAVSNDLYRMIMDERSRMRDDGMDPDSAESLQHFQQLREMFLKNRGG